MVKMKRDWKTYLVSALSLLLLAGGCADVDEETDCTYYLNQKNYDKVATDTSCTTYERASAYMGMAGFQFSNFLAGDASRNFRGALGVPASVTSWSSWVGKTYYENAMKLTGDSTGDTYEGQTRSMDNVEIHYFASLAALTALTYIEMDANSDGQVSESEIQGFTSIKSSSDSSFGRNEIAAAEWIEFITDKGPGSDKVYLLNLSAGTCIRQTAAPYYDGLWDGGSYPAIKDAGCGVIPTPTAAQIAQWAAAGQGSLSITGYCSAVVKIEALQNMFGSSSSGSMSVVDLTENFVSYINKIDRDMVQLGIDTDSDLRKQLTDFSKNIDNGGACSNNTLTEVNQVFSILNVAAQNAASDYQNTNTLLFSTISSASDTTVALSSFSTVVEITLPPVVPVTISFSCTNADSMAARLIYKSGASYVPYYSGADASIKDTFTALKNLNTDASGNVKPTAAGDGIIAIKELVCME